MWQKPRISQIVDRYALFWWVINLDLVDNWLDIY